MADSNGTQQDGWCFAWYQDISAETPATRAALVEESRWPKGATIGVGFMDGTPEQKALVKKFAQDWIDQGGANLTFSWESAENANIRISFKHRGSWSAIGTSCKRVSKKQPTMNFGWLTPGVTDASARGVILHEFGHALGLIHEHQNPLGSIEWNKPAIYKDLAGPPNNWDTATIDRNMFDSYPLQQIQGTQLDKNSIMMYPIPASWVLDPSQAVGYNSQLSATDKAFIKKAYK